MSEDREYDVRYRDPEGEWDEVTVTVRDDEDALDAEEAARAELSASHPSVDTDDWVIGPVVLVEARPGPTR